MENNAIFRSPIGGDVMDQIMLETLDKIYTSAKKSLDPLEIMPRYQLFTKNRQQRNRKFHTLCRLQTARLCKEKVALLADMGYTNDMKGEPSDTGGPTTSSSTSTATQESKSLLYQLPDGTKIRISARDRYEVGELLFKDDEVARTKREELCKRCKIASAVYSIEHAKNSTSSLGEWSSLPIQNIVCNSAFKCDRDQQAQLLGNVVLAGGGACIGGGNAMVDRLRDEVEAIVHTHTPGWKVMVSSPMPPERKICAWLGGSILASLGGFRDMYMTKAEYDEHGPLLVNRKCP